VYNKGAAGALVLGAAGPVILSSSTGVYYKNAPSKNYELANKGYVDSVGLSAANTASTRIPLAGTTSDVPATGGIYFDLKSNSIDPNTVLQFDTLLRTDIRSSYPIEFKTLTNSGYQVLRGDTPASGNNNDLVNRSFLATALNNLITNAIGSRFVRTDAEDTITGSKTFTDTAQIITQGSVPFTLHKGTESTITIEAEAPIVFSGLSGLDTIKVQTAQTVSTDNDATLTTKKFVMDQIEANKPMGSIFSIWSSAAPGSQTYLANYIGWYYATRGKYGEQVADRFSTFFSLTEEGALQYVGNETILLNVSSMISTDQKFYGIQGSNSLEVSFLVRTGSAVKQVLHAVNAAYTETVTQHHGGKNDSDTEVERTRYATNASVTGLILLHKNDILYPLVRGGNKVNLSIIKVG
jgi:hypothetical protein